MSAVMLALALWSSAWAADQVKPLGDTPTTRFADDATPGPTLTAEDECDVLVRDGAKIRVMCADKFGWVEEVKVAKLMKIELPAPTSAPIVLPSNP